MSRTSRVPYHQNVYDLLLLEPRPLVGPLDAIRAWERQTGHTFPAALVEFYTTEGVIPFGIGASDQWVLPLTEVWHQYSNMEPPYPHDRVLVGEERPIRVRGGVEPGPYLRLQCENQGCWIIYARVDGSDDPPTYSTDGGPFMYSDRSEAWPNQEWCRLGTFSEMFFRWIAWYYYDLDREMGGSFVPLRFHSDYADPAEANLAPPKPYHNGLWLRTPADPFEPAVIDYLTEAFDEPERTPRSGNVTTYTFRPPGGTVRVTADEPGLGGAFSAWWVHADTPERLAELGRLILPFGTLRDTLRADTEPASLVLNTLCGTAGK
ncbi:unnamed protein product [Gemmataceae bacterium]|nr:unnamed protein product [Gemmataceae bacterium]VTT99202.1 unnamed protein product [Gemmataceae bacterium]